MKKVNKNRVRFVLLLFAFTSIFGTNTVFSNENRGWPNSPAIQAAASLVMDIHTGTVLIEHNSTEKFYPASITKIMTALVAIEQADSLDEKVLFTREAINIKERESSSIGMTPGEELTLRECLYALMLASANEVANAIAIHIGGSIGEFVDLMNEKAEELGCVNTHFNNPNGLHDPEHYTCALDMAKIGREASKYEEFKKIAGTRSYVIPKTNLMKEERPIANYHQMINPAKYPQYAYDYCYAGKTGYTQEAGMTLVSFAKKGTMNLVSVVLKAETKEAQFGGSIKLLNYCFKRFRMEQAEKINLEFGTHKTYTTLVELDPESSLYIPVEAMLVIPKKADIQKIESKIFYKEPEMIDSEEVGRVEYQYKGKLIGEYPLLYKSKDKEFFKKWIVEEPPTQVEVAASKVDTKEKVIEDEDTFWYKLSLIFGLSIIFVTLLGIALRFLWRRRKDKIYIHKSLRISKRKRWF